MLMASERLDDSDSIISGQRQDDIVRYGSRILEGVAAGMSSVRLAACCTSAAAASNTT